MKKGLVLLFAFILTAAFSADVFAGGAKTNFGVKNREKKVAEQRISQEKVKEAPAKKIPVVQPIVETAVTATTTVVSTAVSVTDAMYTSVVDTMLGKIGKMKEEEAAGKTKAAVEKPRETEQPVKQEMAQAVPEAKPQQAKVIAETPKKKERIKREIEPKRRSSNIK